MFTKKKNADLPQIIEAIRYGDEHAYNVLISRTYNNVLTYCNVFGSKFDAHDLAQETYLRAIKSKFINKEITSVEGLLISIAKCVCSDYVNEQQKIRKIRDGLYVEITQNEYVVDEDIQLLLSCLSPEMRESFVLTQLFGFSYEETSKLCSVTIGTIKSRVSRSKDLLRNKVQNTYSAS